MTEFRNYLRVFAALGGLVLLVTLWPTTSGYHDGLSIFLYLVEIAAAVGLWVRWQNLREKHEEEVKTAWRHGIEYEQNSAARERAGNGVSA